MEATLITGWKFCLLAQSPTRDGVGARIKLTASDLVLYDQRKGGMSYSVGP